MPEIERPRRSSVNKRKLIGRCLVSLVSVCVTQLSLYLVCYSFISSSFIVLILLSVMALVLISGIGRCCKKFLGLRASAPAFVLMNILFLWCVHIIVIRQVVSPVPDIIFNAGILMLVIGLYSIMSSDPGFINYAPASLDKLVSSDVEANAEALGPLRCGTCPEFSPDENIVSALRVRYCRQCKVYVKGFDHHCPAFGNCVGQNNHILFITLLSGLIIAEASYIACSSHFVTSRTVGSTGRKPVREVLVISTRIFVLLQLSWQVVFLAWHIYCVCTNIKTDEWINWKSYPEFQHFPQPQPGQLKEARFVNPFDKGILQNLKEFIEAKG